MHVRRTLPHRWGVMVYQFDVLRHCATEGQKKGPVSGERGAFRYGRVFLVDPMLQTIQRPSGVKRQRNTAPPVPPSWLGYPIDSRIVSHRGFQRHYRRVLVVPLYRSDALHLFERTPGES